MNQALELYKKLAVNHCYQCRKCSGGCPVSSEMDLKPNEIMRLVQLDKLDKVIASNSIWLCIGCQTCTVRCPNNVQVAQVIEELKNCAHNRTMTACGASVQLQQAFRSSLEKYGRIHEIELFLSQRKLSQEHLSLKGISLGVNMLIKGKLKLRSPGSNKASAVKELIALTKEGNQWN